MSRSAPASLSQLHPQIPQSEQNQPQSPTPIALKPAPPDETRIEHRIISFFPCFSERCDGCNSSGLVFKQQQPHHQTCISQSVAAMLVSVEDLESSTNFLHSVTIICGADTTKLRIIPSAEFFQCGYCGGFFSRSSICHHIITCSPRDDSRDELVTEPFDHDFEYNNYYSETSDVKQNELLSKFAVFSKFVSFSYLYLLFRE